MAFDAIMKKGPFLLFYEFPEPVVKAFIVLYSNSVLIHSNRSKAFEEAARVIA